MALGRQLSVEILMLFVIGLVLGMMGPFGTYAMPAGIRLIYWTGFILVGYIFFRPISFVTEWISEISPIPVWLSIIMANAVAAFPLAILIALAIGGFRWAGNPMLSDGFGLLYAQVAAIGVGIFLFMRLLFGPEKAPATSEEGKQPVTAPPESIAASSCLLHARLPANFALPIAALGVEDHYVRVFGMQGASEMLLMRLSDAIREMDGVDGLQVHRSWWVARGAVERAERDGRKVTLQLSNGMNIPVSRSYVAPARRAGLLS